MITPVGLLDILAADLDGTFCQQTKGYSKVILAPAEKNDHYFHILNTRYHLMLSAPWDISRCTFAVMGLLNTWTQMSKSRFASLCLVLEDDDVLDVGRVGGLE